MKVLCTGMNGTVAPVVADCLRERGHAVMAWDRSRVSPDDGAAVSAFVVETAADWVFHAATGSPAWAELLAATCAGTRTRLLQVSSASVFSGRNLGPLPPDAEPDATDEYGRYKIECERRVATSNADALIVRIGWQIADSPGKNNMLTYLTDAEARDGFIRASTCWFPACSFLRDTAQTLVELMERDARGTYQLDGNPGLSMYEIAAALNTLHGAGWKVVATDEFAHDNRMSDPRVTVRPISDVLALE